MEIEAKILEVDPKSLTNRLEMLNAHKIFDGEINTQFYDSQDDSISRKGDLLRLRQIDEKVFLTYKNHISDGAAKIMDEFETEVRSLEEMKSILILLGFHVTETMRKHRTSYSLGQRRIEIDVHLDNYSFIPPLMEIETFSIQDILETAKQLGYNEGQLLDWSFFRVAEYYRKSTML